MAAAAARHAGVALDGDHAGSGLGQPGCDRAAAGPEVEDEPALGRAAAADKLVDQRLVTQKVGTGRIRCWRPPP
jgi:hypothetical protein